MVQLLIVTKPLIPMYIQFEPYLVGFSHPQSSTILKPPHNPNFLCLIINSCPSLSKRESLRVCRHLSTVAYVHNVVMCRSCCQPARQGRASPSAPGGAAATCNLQHRPPGCIRLHQVALLAPSYSLVVVNIVAP